MITADTSAVVAAFASWHEDHRAALKALSGGTRLIAQVAFETYAVLTRLPPPHRAPAEIVVEYLNRTFEGPLITMPERLQRQLLATCAAGAIVGGAVYDAVIAATAVHAGATLVTLDKRALTTYESLGVRVRLLS